MWNQPIANFYLKSIQINICRTSTPFPEIQFSNLYEWDAVKRAIGNFIFIVLMFTEMVQ